MGARSARCSRLSRAAGSEPDEGIWEVRGPRRHFTHSKVMAWVAFDRAVQAVERVRPRRAGRALAGVRDEIHAEVSSSGFDAELGSFVQSYGSKRLDASLLLIPLVGFLPPDDPRVRRHRRGGAARAAARRLRAAATATTKTSSRSTACPPGEGAFFLCSFWLVDNLRCSARLDEARELFERLLVAPQRRRAASEEYDPELERLLGNFPQAFSHIGLINTAMLLEEALAEPVASALVARRRQERDRGVDEREMDESLREVAEELAASRVDLLGVEADVVRGSSELAPSARCPPRPARRGRARRRARTSR